MTQLPVTPLELVQCADFLNRVSLARWRKTTAKQVVNTINPTDLLNSEINIDAGAMMTDRALRLTAWGDMINNTGATQAAPRFQLRTLLIPGTFTTLLDTGAIPAVWATNATRQPWRIVAEIVNLGATGSQWASLEVEGLATLAASTTIGFATGEGLYTAPTNSAMLKALGGAACTVDTTLVQNLLLAVILPTASASCDVTLKAAVIELV